LTLLERDSKYKCREDARYSCGVELLRNGEVIMVICPECESDLDIEEDEVDEGEVVSCPECGTDFEVVTVEPLELTKVEDEDEEEDDEEDEKDDSE
jgi:alpha-aminoadipate carrier protein LysW